MGVRLNLRLQAFQFGNKLFGMNFGWCCERTRFSLTRWRQILVQPGVIANWNVIEPSRQPNINAAENALKQQKYLFDVSARNLILSI